MRCLPLSHRSCKDVCHRAHLVEHSGHLTGHQAAGGGVALKDGAAQAAQRVLFQLHLVGPGLFLPDILAAHAVFQHTHRCAADAAGDDGVAVLGLEQGGFVVFVDGALLAHQQAGAHLHAAGTQCQRSGQLTAVGDAARRNDGHAAPRPPPGGTSAMVVISPTWPPLSVPSAMTASMPSGSRCFASTAAATTGNHLDAGGFPRGNILAGVACAGGDHLHAFFHHDLGKLVGLRVHQHDVHAEGLVGQLLAAADVLAQGVGVHAARADDAQRTRVGAGGGKLAGGDVGHAALDDGVFCRAKISFKSFIKFSCERLPLGEAFYCLYSTIVPPQVRPPPKPMQAIVCPGLQLPGLGQLVQGYRDAGGAGVAVAVHVLVEFCRVGVQRPDAVVDDAAVGLMADHPVHLVQRLLRLVQHGVQTAGQGIHRKAEDGFAVHRDGGRTVRGTARRRGGRRCPVRPA